MAATGRGGPKLDGVALEHAEGLAVDLGHEHHAVEVLVDVLHGQRVHVPAVIGNGVHGGGGGVDAGVLKDGGQRDALDDDVAHIGAGGRVGLAVHLDGALDHLVLVVGELEGERVGGSVAVDGDLPVLISLDRRVVVGGHAAVVVVLPVVEDLVGVGDGVLREAERGARQVGDVGDAHVGLVVLHEVPHLELAGGGAHIVAGVAATAQGGELRARVVDGVHAVLEVQRLGVAHVAELDGRVDVIGVPQLGVRHVHFLGYIQDGGVAAALGAAALVALERSGVPQERVARNGLELRAVLERHNLGGVLRHSDGRLVLLGDLLSHARVRCQAGSHHRASKHACSAACQQPCGNPSLHDASPFSVVYRMHAGTPPLGRASLLTRRPSDSA